jgi:hypothetical protein
MDSSRSGLLSTLLMTLPLIVVPALALLRQPGQDASVSTTRLDASENGEDDFLDDLDSLDLSQEPTGRGSPKTASADSSDDDIAWMFEDPPPADSKPAPISSSTRSSRTPKSNRSEMDSRTESAPPRENSGMDADIDDEFREVEESTISVDETIEQLNAMGAMRTMWFEASDRSPVGLAVFFRGDTDNERIRFEAVGQTREDCANDVMKQVNQWQTERNQPTGGPSL